MGREKTFGPNLSDKKVNLGDLKNALELDNSIWGHFKNQKVKFHPPPHADKKKI